MLFFGIGFKIICFLISKMTWIKCSLFLFPYFVAGMRTTTLLLRCVRACHWTLLVLLTMLCCFKKKFAYFLFLEFCYVFHAVRLACFDGKSTAFSKFNQGTGYSATTTRPNKVNDFIITHKSSRILSGQLMVNNLVRFFDLYF